MQKRIRQKSIPKNAYDAGFSRVCLYTLCNASGSSMSKMLSIMIAP